MDGGIHVACRRGRWSGRGRRCARSDRWPQRAPASDARPPTREGGGAGAAPHQAAPRSGFRRCFVPTPITGRGRRTQRERELLDSSKGRVTTGERQDVCSDLRKRGTRCDQVCANGRDLPCGDALPSDEDRKTGPVVEQVAYLRQHWKRATRYARKSCRVAAAMAYALRGTCGTNMVRPSMRGQLKVGHGRAWTRERDHLCAAWHGLSGQCGGASSRPRFGDRRRAPATAYAPAAISSATDYAHDPVTRSAKAVTGGATTYATFRHARGDLDRREAGGGRPFMRSSDLAANCRRRPAAD